MKNLSFKNKKKRIAKRLNGKKSVKKYKGGDKKYYSIDNADNEYEIETSKAPAAEEGCTKEECDALKEQVKTLTSQIELKQAEIEKITHEKTLCEQQIIAKDETIADLKSQIAVLNEQIKILIAKKSSDTQTTEKTIETKLQEVKGQCEGVEAELAACKTEREDLKREIKKLKLELKTANECCTELVGVKKTLEAREKDLTELKARFETEVHKYSELNNRFTQVSNDNATCQGVKTELESQIKEVSRKLQDYIDKYEALLKAAKADQIETPDKGTHIQQELKIEFPPPQALPSVTQVNSSNDCTDAIRVAVDKATEALKERNQELTVIITGLQSQLTDCTTERTRLNDENINLKTKMQVLIAQLNACTMTTEAREETDKIIVEIEALLIGAHVKRNEEWMAAMKNKIYKHTGKLKDGEKSGGINNEGDLYEWTFDYELGNQSAGGGATTAELIYKVTSNTEKATEGIDDLAEPYSKFKGIFRTWWDTEKSKPSFSNLGDADEFFDRHLTDAFNGNADFQDIQFKIQQFHGALVQELIHAEAGSTTPSPAASTNGNQNNAGNGKGRGEGNNLNNAGKGKGRGEGNNLNNAGKGKGRGEGNNLNNAGKGKGRGEGNNLNNAGKGKGRGEGNNLNNAGKGKGRGEGNNENNNHENDNVIPSGKPGASTNQHLDSDEEEGHSSAEEERNDSTIVGLDPRTLPPSSPQPGQPSVANAGNEPLPVNRKLADNISQDENVEECNVDQHGEGIYKVNNLVIMKDDTGVPHDWMGNQGIIRKDLGDKFLICFNKEVNGTYHGEFTKNQFTCKKPATARRSSLIGATADVAEVNRLSEEARLAADRKRKNDALAELLDGFLQKAIGGASGGGKNKKNKSKKKKGGKNNRKTKKQYGGKLDLDEEERSAGANLEEIKIGEDTDILRLILEEDAPKRPASEVKKIIFPRKKDYIKKAYNQYTKLFEEMKEKYQGNEIILEIIGAVDKVLTNSTVIMQKNPIHNFDTTYKPYKVVKQHGRKVNALKLKHFTGDKFDIAAELNEMKDGISLAPDPDSDDEEDEEKKPAKKLMSGTKWVYDAPMVMDWMRQVNNYLLKSYEGDLDSEGKLVTEVLTDFSDTSDLVQYLSKYFDKKNIEDIIPIFIGDVHEGNFNPGGTANQHNAEATGNLNNAGAGDSGQTPPPTGPPAGPPTEPQTGNKQPTPEEKAAAEAAAKAAAGEAAVKAAEEAAEKAKQSIVNANAASALLLNVKSFKDAEKIVSNIRDFVKIIEDQLVITNTALNVVSKIPDFKQKVTEAHGIVESKKQQIDGTLNYAIKESERIKKRRRRKSSSNAKND